MSTEDSAVGGLTFRNGDSRHVVTWLWRHRRHERLSGSLVGFLTDLCHDHRQTFVQRLVTAQEPLCAAKHDHCNYLATAILHRIKSVHWPYKFCTLFWGHIPPVKPIFGAWKGTFKRNGQNIITSILSKLLHLVQTNFAQWQRSPNTLHGWANTRKTNRRWRTATILKNRKRPYLQSPKWFDRSAQNLAWLCVLALRTVSAVKISDF